MVKFKDIKPFVRDGSYEIDVFVDSIEDTLNGYMKDYGLDLNPDFQRGHVWTEEQQTAYVEFFLRGGKTARVIYFNSPAFGNSMNGDLDDTILCIDGLQRLTSIRKFINNELRVFGHYFNEYEDKIGLRHTLKFNINSLENKKDVLEWYLQFNSGGTIHSKEELDKVRALIDKLK